MYQSPASTRLRASCRGSPPVVNPKTNWSAVPLIVVTAPPTAASVPRAAFRAATPAAFRGMGTVWAALAADIVWAAETRAGSQIVEDGGLAGRGRLDAATGVETSKTV